MIWLSNKLYQPVIELLDGFDGEPETDSSASTEAALRQMEVALADLKTAFKELKPPKKARAKASQKRRKPATRPRKRK